MPPKSSLSPDEQQSLALAIARAKRRWNPSAGSWPHFRAIAHSNAMTDIRRARSREAKRRRKTVHLEDVIPEPSIPTFLDALAAIDHASYLASLLSGRERAILVATFLTGLSRSETATMLGISPEAVTKVRANGIKRLRATIRK